MDPLWLIYQIAARRPSVFFSPGFNAPAICAAPFVFTMHDLIKIRSPELATPCKRLYYELVLKPAARRAHRVLTVSNYSRSEILTWSGLPSYRVVNVGNGVSQEFHPDGPRYSPGFPYIFCIGNHRPHKNLYRLFHAFRELNYPDVRLLLTGHPTVTMFHRLREMDIDRKVKFLGPVPDEDLPAIYRGALLLVLPSLIEGFGLPALEAMACGTPVVASNTTALPEVVGDGGILVDPLDVDDLWRGCNPELMTPGCESACGSAGCSERVCSRGIT